MIVSALSDERLRLQPFRDCRSAAFSPAQTPAAAPFSAGSQWSGSSPLLDLTNWEINVDFFRLDQEAVTVLIL